MKIAILDFKFKNTDHVGEALARIGVAYEYVPYDSKAEDLQEYDGIIFNGSADTVYAGGHLCDPGVLKMDKMKLGICYGHQLIHYMLGGEVRKAKDPEHEPMLLHGQESLLFAGLPLEQMVAMDHDDEVVKMAPGFKLIGTTDTCMIAATENPEAGIVSVQFHPEIKGNDYGDEIFRNFIKML